MNARIIQFAVLMIACLSNTLLASSKTAVLEIVDIVHYSDDPLYKHFENWANKEILSFDFEKDWARENKNKENVTIASAKIKGMKQLLKEIRKSTKNDAVKIHCWDGLNSEYLTIYYRGADARTISRLRKSGDLIRCAYETKSKHVSMRSAKKISWRRSSADGKKDYTPHIDDDIEWHWSIDGWGDKWVIKGMLAGAERHKSLLHGNPPDFQSEPTYYSTPTIHEVTEYSKNTSKPMGWNTRPASNIYPWSTQTHIDMGDIDLEINDCTIEQRPTKCIWINGDLTNVYSVKFHLYKIQENGERGKRITPKDGIVIGGETGHKFGSGVHKPINSSQELPIDIEINSEYEVEIIEVEKFISPDQQ
jgi:hypothetical protein